MRTAEGQGRHGMSRKRRGSGTGGLALALAIATGAVGLAATPAGGVATFNGPVEIVPAHSGGSVQVSLPFASPGLPVTQRFVDGGEFERWNMLEFGAGTGAFVIQSRGAGLVLDVSGGSTSAGAGLVINPWTGSASQVWIVAQLLPPYPFYVLINAKSGQVMDVAGSSQLPAAVIQWPWRGGLNQIFAL